MKTSIDIPDEELLELMKNTKATKKKDAVLIAISEYNRRARQAGLTKYLGTFSKFLTSSELEKSRSSRVDS